MRRITFSCDFHYAESQEFSVILLQGLYIVLVKGKQYDHFGREYVFSPETAMRVLKDLGGVPRYENFFIRSSAMLASETLTVELVNACIDRFNERVRRKNRKQRLSVLPELQWSSETTEIATFRDFEVI